MRKQILITGGAGFIGSHLADRLLEKGHAVRVLDNLSPQVHGAGQRRPPYLDRAVELIVGDVRNVGVLELALNGVDVVYHFAAAIGVGQSMYQVVDYASVNTLGTAVLLETLLRRKVERLVVASSMSVYGEGLYRMPTGDGRPVEVAARTLEQLRRGEWDISGDGGTSLIPHPTPETKSPTLESVYALSKYDQERLVQMMGRAYGVPTVALRFFNAYGPRQALSNPYTGVLAIFASRLLNGRAPLIFEDGMQMRDFVSVHDVSRACVLAIEKEDAIDHVINVGSGKPRTILDVASAMAHALGKGDLSPEITGKYRMGDVRHCFADVGLARKLLGFEPRVDFADGLLELVGWLAGQLAKDRTTEAKAELEARGLTL